MVPNIVNREKKQMLKPYGGLGVTTFPGAGGSQAIYAFVTRIGGHLYVNWWNGQQWVWQDQGTPPGTTVDNAPSVITFPGAGGSQAIYAFVAGGNGQLYVNWWNGQQWVWQDEGTPARTTAGGRMIL